MFIVNKDIIDCDVYEWFIEGWYYYDKYKIKILLSGYLNNCDIKLYNYGKNYLKILKEFM